MKGSLSSFGILIEKIYLIVKREIYLTTKEKRGGRREEGRNREKSVFDKILLKKPSEILSVAEKGRKRGDETNFNHK